MEDSPIRPPSCPYTSLPPLFFSFLSLCQHLRAKRPGDIHTQRHATRFCIGLAASPHTSSKLETMVYSLLRLPTLVVDVELVLPLSWHAATAHHLHAQHSTSMWGLTVLIPCHRASPSACQQLHLGVLAHWCIWSPCPRPSPRVEPPPE